MKRLIARRTYMPLNDGKRYNLRVYDTGRYRDGKMVIAYRFADAEGVIFESEDFYAPAFYSPAKLVSALMSFLTLRKGDTDSGYFDSYTERQVAFRDSYACEVIAGEVN